MNNVDFYLFLTFSGLICHLAFKGTRIFCVALCRMIVKETEFGSSNQEASSSTETSTEGIFEVYVTRMCIPTLVQIFPTVRYCHSLQ